MYLFFETILLYVLADFPSFHKQSYVKYPEKIILLRFIFGPEQFCNFNKIMTKLY